MVIHCHSSNQQSSPLSSSTLLVLMELEGLFWFLMLGGNVCYRDVWVNEQHMKTRSVSHSHPFCPNCLPVQCLSAPSSSSCSLSSFRFQVGSVNSSLRHDDDDDDDEESCCSALVKGQRSVKAAGSDVGLLSLQERKHEQ